MNSASRGRVTAAAAHAVKYASHAICTPEHGASTITSWPFTSIDAPLRVGVEAGRLQSQALSCAVTTRSGKPR